MLRISLKIKWDLFINKYYLYLIIHFFSHILINLNAFLSSCQLLSFFLILIELHFPLTFLINFLFLLIHSLIKLMQFLSFLILILLTFHNFSINLIMFLIHLIKFMILINLLLKFFQVKNIYFVIINFMYLMIQFILSFSKYLNLIINILLIF